MELHQLAYFVAVAEEAGFTRAAERMRVAQPGISQQVRRLERELGETLLDRSGRQVRLTTAGAAFLPHARGALSAVARGRESVDELRGLLTGRVAIGMTANLPGIDLPRLLAEFQQLHPGVQVTLTEANADAILDRVRSDDLDIGLAGLPDRPPPDIGSRLLATLPLVIVTSRDDPLTSCTNGRLELIRDRSLVTLPRGSALRQLLDTGCAQAGFQPRIRYEASNLQLLIELTAHGLGIAIVPAWAAETEPSRLHTISIRTPTLRGHAFLLWRTRGPASPAAREFLAVAQRHLPGRQPSSTVVSSG